MSEHPNSEWPASAIVVYAHAKMHRLADRRVFNALLVSCTTRADLIDLVTTALAKR